MLLPSAASARTQYYCRMTGQLVGSDACDKGAASQLTRPAQQVQLPDCCQRLSSSNRNASLGVLDTASPVAAATHVATIPNIFGAGPSGALIGFCAESTQAPLALGPPLFLAHCAFLS
jgi:hypothetical protein